MTDRLVDRLTKLRVPAPHRLLGEVLAATGLADRYVVRDSPLGPVYVAFNDRGVSSIDLAADDDAFETTFRRRFDRPIVPGTSLPRPIETRLDRAIAEGKPGALPLDLSSVTPFQAAALLKTAEIPSGEVRPYGWVAREIGKPGAVRAVGSALARNPVPIVVPCHRVVRSDGTFGDYSLGDPRNKRVLLEAEGVDTGELEHRARRGVRFVGSDTTRIYCHPTCRDARRITEPHLVEFRNAVEASRAGYRPCRRCRPATAA